MNISKYFVYLLTAAVFLSANGSSLSRADQLEGSLEWKNYVIRFDRGWDILCEPYEVQPNDWVLKIFSQKGELSHEDFREFLGIFVRLNPQVKDIDRIRPGQVIDIPLKKLTQGALSGQSSGIVTIPFVSLNSVDEVLNENAAEYTIRPGDCVSVIIAKRFGIYGSDSYAKGLKMFQALNPQVEDINQIMAGQKVYLPAPSIQEQPWYASMFDSQGNLTEKIGMSASKNAMSTGISHRRPASQSSTGSPAQNTTSNDPLAQTAEAIDGKLLNKGTLYFTLSTGKNFELDLSKYPILEKKNGERFILTRENSIMGVDVDLLQTMLPSIKIVKISQEENTDQVIEAVLENQDSLPANASLNISEYGTEIWLQAKWIETIESNEDDVPRKICIMPIQSASERTASSISRYLSRHNIVLKEVLSDSKGVFSAESSPTDVSARYTIVTSISASDNKQFVREFAQVMKWHYASGVSISFPYADVQIEALSNMLSSDQGGEVLIDFEDLYGDAILAIEKTGLKVVQIRKNDSPAAIAGKLLQSMKTAYTENPAFMAAQRVSPYNTTVRIKGFLLDNQPTEKILLSTNSLNQKVVDFLESTGLRVIMLGQSKLFY